MNSIIIARFLGPLLLASAAAVLVNRKGIEKLAADFAKHTPAIYLTGVMSLLGGLAIVQFHNVWSGWQVLITILGWMSIFRGIFRMVAPDQTAKMIEKVVTKGKGKALAGMAVVSGMIGLFLTIEGLLK